METKRAVVFSGGGAKGGYQIGVWKALTELGYFPDIVVGTSVGALNGALMAMERYDDALKVWENMGMGRVFQQFAEDADQTKERPSTVKNAMTKLIKECVFDRGGDYTPLQDLVHGLMDEDRLRGSRISYGLVTTKLSGSLEAQELFIEDIPYGEAADYILASAACFPFMKSYRIRGTKFVDGGYSDNIPIEMALKKGASELVVVNIGGNVARQRKVPVCDAKIHYIHSRNGFSSAGPASTVLFDGERSLMHIQQGYLDTRKAFDDLDGYAYTFEKGEVSGEHDLALCCCRLFDKIFSGLPNSSRLEKTGQKKVLQVLNSFIEKPFLYNSSFLSCLECAARIFNVDYLKIYKMEELCREVINSYTRHLSAQDTGDLLRIRDILDKRTGSDVFSAVVSALNAEDAMCYAAQLLLQNKISPSQKKQLWMAASALPECFCGAIFIAGAVIRQNAEDPTGTSVL